jgi:prephenate dehydrogenase
VPPDWRDTAAGSFRDGTRVASSSPDLWADILIDNRYAVISALAAHVAWIEKAKAALEYRDTAGLLQLLADAAAAKSSFPSEDRSDG